MTSAPFRPSRRATLILLSVVLLYLMATSLYQAAGRALWFDEICTMTVASQGSLPGIWKALSEAVDTNPPLFYVVERASRALPGTPEVVYRIPQMLGCLTLMGALYVFVRRPAGHVAGLAAALMPPLMLVRNHFFEARPYGIVLGLLAVAAAAWPRCDRWPAAALYTIALAAATGMHYYAVFGVLCFGMAELVLAIVRRRVRIAASLALIAPVLMLLSCWPLLKVLREYYGSNFWAVPGPGQLISGYDVVLHLPVGVGAGVATLLFLGAAGSILASARGSVLRAEGLEEMILAAALLTLPAVSFLAARLTHGGMTERYMLPVAIGIAAAAGLLAARSGERVALGLVVFLLAALVLRDAKMWVDYGRRGPLVPQPESMALVRDVLDHEPDPNIPMVISSGVTFLPASYYGTPLYGHRIVALTDYAAALRYVRSDSVDRALQRLRLYLPIEVQPFEGFAPKHPRFYVFSNYESFDWWPRRLLEDGYSMRVIRLTEKQAVYLVEQRVGK